MPLPGFLTKVFGGKVAEITDSITGGLDKLFTSKEEKLAAELKIQEALSGHLEKMEALAQSEVDMYLKDTQDARSNFTKIQESTNASWLAKNILPVLAVGVTLGFFGLLGYMLKFQVPKDNERIMDILLGSLGTAWISIIGYFFGSSAGSKANADVIRKIVDK